MRRLVGMTIAVLTLVGGPAVAAAASDPTPHQEHVAVVRAEQSKSLWATVNICNPNRRYRDDLGVRGQMPSLGFPAWLSMNVRLYYFSRSAHRYLAVPSRGSKLVRLGRSSHGLQQSGALFEFAPHQPTLKATVTFIWRREGRLLGQTTRDTTAGHPNADFASPPHASAATCTIH